jgi:hypothetical protein
LASAGDQHAARHEVCTAGCERKGIPMKKVLFALVATLVAVSVSGCVGVGKGKAPPPIVRKG